MKTFGFYFSFGKPRKRLFEHTDISLTVSVWRITVCFARVDIEGLFEQMLVDLKARNGSEERLQHMQKTIDEQNDHVRELTERELDRQHQIEKLQAKTDELYEINEKMTHDKDDLYDEITDLETTVEEANTQLRTVRHEEERLYRYHKAQESMSKRILILEDDPARVIQFKSRMVGNHITVVDNPAEAMHELMKHSWDIVCLDHDLGGQVFVPSGVGTGYEVAAWLAEHPKYKPTHIVLHTLHDEGRANMLVRLPEAVALPGVWFMPFERLMHILEDSENDIRSIIELGEPKQEEDSEGNS